jgi:hypothetical protein
VEDRRLVHTNTCSQNSRQAMLPRHEKSPVSRAFFVAGL